MKVLGRNIRLSRVPAKLRDLAVMIWNARQFRDPIGLFRSYLSKTNPSGNLCRLANGSVLNLSTNQHDAVTVMVIFCRREYGAIRKGSVVVDIGANIGMFSMYAAFNGARRVLAFEPNPEAFAILSKNIADNDLGGVVQAIQMGVSNEDGRTMFIPRGSSPYNAVRFEQGQGEVEVETVSLPTILRDLVKEEVDLCKIDCEGAEYEILFSTPRKSLDQIREIRMEHHAMERRDELLRYFSQNDFRLLRERNKVLWFRQDRPEAR